MTVARRKRAAENPAMAGVDKTGDPWFPGDMDTAAEPVFRGRAVGDFCEYYFLTDGAARRFLSAPSAGQRNLVARWLIGPETERYAMEPIYARTGKGYLKSKGVEGLLKEREIYDHVHSGEGRRELAPFLEAAKLRAIEKIGYGDT